MKVRLLTFHAVPNYGAALQAFALQNYLVSLGHEVSFIDYRPAYLTTGGKFHFPKNRWAVEANLIIAYQKYMALRNLGRGMRTQLDLFRDFHNKFLNIEGPRYENLKQLNEKKPTGDLFLAGSDQIWNPSKQFGLDPAFFLGFAPTSATKATYAASIGKSTLPHRYHQTFQQLTSNLDAISVREASGQTLVRSLAHRDSTIVPDPTFLIDWNHLPHGATDVEIRKKQVFFYVLRDGTGLYDFQEYLSNKNGFDVVQPLNPHQRWRTYGKVIAMGPWDWLREIQASEFVVTNSFHGTVFAILFNKPFVTIGLGGTRSAFNERMNHLLLTLGLSTQHADIKDFPNLADLMQRQHNWQEIRSRALQLQQAGKKYLGDLLQKTAAKA